jgi:hypothetical protein
MWTWGKRSMYLDFFKLIQVGPPRSGPMPGFFFSVLLFFYSLNGSFFICLLRYFFICSFSDIMKCILFM